MKIINGQKIADKILKNLKTKNATLAVILVGKNPASHLYVAIKEKRAKQIGIGFKKYLLPEKTSLKLILKLILKLNHDKNITAILVQLPLPKHLDSNKIIFAIDPKKDADGLHPQSAVLPATTGAIIEALKYIKVNLKKKSVAIIGKSKIVGRPTYYYLKNKVKKINIYDKSTKNLAQKTSQANILIIAIGQANFITRQYIKPGAIVIDVGINKIGNKTVGDADFQSIKKTAGYITPVPGGIGPITVSVLLKNVIKLKKN